MCFYLLVYLCICIFVYLCICVFAHQILMNIFLRSSYHNLFKNIAHVVPIFNFSQSCICLFVYLCICVFVFLIFVFVTLREEQRVEQVVCLITGLGPLG